MDVNEALQFADEWTKGHTFYEGLQGWRVVCAVLAAEVRRLQAPAVEAAHHEDMEDAIEKAYWEFDAKKNGYGKYALNTKPERDAFKSEMRKAIRKFALDDDTRKLVLELLDELDTYSLDPYLSRRSKEIVKILKEKLGAGDE